MSQRLLTRSCPARCSKAVAGIADSGRYLTEAAGDEALTPQLEGERHVHAEPP